jgi:hypothetical protein
VLTKIIAQVTAKVSELTGDDKVNGEVYIKVLQRAVEKVGWFAWGVSGMIVIFPSVLLEERLTECPKHCARHTVFPA